MQIGRANYIVQPGSQVSSELWNTVRTHRAAGPRSSVFSFALEEGALLNIASENTSLKVVFPCQAGLNTV